MYVTYHILFHQCSTDSSTTFGIELRLNLGLGYFGCYVGWYTQYLSL